MGVTVDIIMIHKVQHETRCRYGVSDFEIMLKLTFAKLSPYAKSR